MATEDSVKDEKRKLTAEELGKLQKKTNEIVKRVEEGVISYEDALEVMQKIIIEGKSGQHLCVSDGKASITYLKHIIDCEEKPFTPEGWKVEVHLKRGFIEFNPENVSLYLSEYQKNGSITGFNLRNEILYKPVMNANVLDYLLAHPELIPEEWKSKAVFFWGTIYRNSDGGLCVRCLSWDGSRWYWHFRWLALGFLSDCPAALAS
jgi:hypothetical protein